MLSKLFSRSAILAALTGMLVFGSPAAEAKTQIHIFIGLPGFPHWYGPGYYGPHYRWRLTCAEGRRIVDRRDYDRVRAIDCRPRYYYYRASKAGRWYIVGLDSVTGRIVSVKRD
ncbi:MAG: hypothetical protein HY245_09575 [Rhizobiales bacterium]|nr:hypothetical protein [Hyphomicrobiales bacterium]MBI3673651.1 hypothetical protein [Hyphomicrobiales bacterium]